MINNERVHHSHLALTSTGASSGFGLRLARSALKRGDRVIATAKSLDKLQNLLVANIDPVLRNNLHTLQLDVTEGETTLKAKASEAAAIWGQIDVLVNNADELRPLRIQRKEVPRIFGDNLLPMCSGKQAVTVVIGSRSAWRTEIAALGVVQGIGHYSASKAAVHSLTETLATEVAPFNIRVLLVAPGSFRTEGIYNQEYNMSNPIAANTLVREDSATKFKALTQTGQGDPAKAMEAVVDIVRGEGIAKGRPWPNLLILGEDAGRDVRNKCNKVLEALDEWKDVTCGVNLD
ncbi:hypothetical protein E4T56_gene12054 [Termitomyces sp. T112]|nr:hypothetical protein E4T56_gene12054 [Termitomyces sp. T112]